MYLDTMSHMEKYNKEYMKDVDEIYGARDFTEHEQRMLAHGTMTDVDANRILDEPDLASGLPPILSTPLPSYSAPPPRAPATVYVAPSPIITAPSVSATDLVTIANMLNNHTSSRMQSHLHNASYNTTSFDRLYKWAINLVPYSWGTKVHSPLKDFIVGQLLLDLPEYIIERKIKEFIDELHKKTMDQVQAPRRRSARAPRRVTRKASTRRSAKKAPARRTAKKATPRRSTKKAPKA
jgi:hypothetical protein